MKIIIWLMVVLLGAGAAEVGVEQLFNVKTTTVTKGTISRSKSYYGSVEADESRIYDVVARFGGYIGRVDASIPFQTIKKGGKLFDVYSPELFLAASELLNTLDSRHDELKESIVKKMRLMGLDGRVITQIIRKKEVPEYLPFYSPYEGVATEIKVRHGSGIKAGEKLFTIADYSKVWVLVRVYESDIGFLSSVTAATVRTEEGQRSFPARIEAVYPAVSPKDKSVTMRLEVDNPHLELFPGRFVTAELAATQKTGLLLPQSAVITKGANHFVFVAGEYEGEYEPRKIKARRLPGGAFEIEEGLEEGERVVDDSLFLFDSDAMINGLY